MNYAENEPIAHIDLHGLQKHKPKGQSIDKPSDLVSTKMLNNLKEGAKTVAVEMGRIISDAVNTVGEIIEGAAGTEAPSEVPGGLAGSAENGQGNETRVNESAENIELDEFTSGAIPKPPAGKVGAMIRAGAKAGVEVAEQLQEDLGINTNDTIYDCKACGKLFKDSSGIKLRTDNDKTKPRKKIDTHIN